MSISADHDHEVIAIDGPAASGKSTVSRRLAQKLQWIYVDSGSFYRGITWKAIRADIDIEDPDVVLAKLDEWSWDMRVDDGVLRYAIGGEDPGIQIRSEIVTENVSHIASISELREGVVARLRSTLDHGNIVMEGRDIGSVVFPDTPWKYYLDADAKERAKRRNREMAKMEGQSDVNKVMDSLTRRDALDSTRKTSPLQIPLGAHVINSTDMTLEDVVDVILADRQKRIQQG